MKLNNAPFKYFVSIAKNELETTPLYVVAAGDLASLVALVTGCEQHNDYILKSAVIKEITQNELFNLMGVDSWNQCAQVTLDWRKSFKSVMFEIPKKDKCGPTFVVTSEQYILDRINNES